MEQFWFPNQCHIFSIGHWILWFGGRFGEMSVFSLDWNDPTISFYHFVKTDITDIEKTYGVVDHDDCNEMISKYILKLRYEWSSLM